MASAKAGPWRMVPDHAPYTAEELELVQAALTTACRAIETFGEVGEDAALEEWARAERDRKEG